MKTQNLPPELAAATQAIGAGIGKALDTAVPHTARCTCCRRVDALMIEDLVRTAIEIKVSRADAARETWQKARPWWRVCHRFIYVVPAGLIEHPPIFGAGLWWVHPDGRIEVKRRARVSKTPEPLPQLVVQNIALRATACTAYPREGDDQ